MLDPAEMDARDGASELLGMASGLAHMCCGSSEDTSEQAKDLTHVVSSLKHAQMLLAEARGLLSDRKSGPTDIVDRALSVCTLVEKDIAVETGGRWIQHWSNEITAWGLHALCDVIDRAKDAVDKPAEHPEEASHG